MTRTYGTGTYSLVKGKVGVYRFRVFTEDPITGKRKQVSKTVHTKSRPNKKDLKRQLAAFKNEVDQGLHNGSATTVGKLLDDWMANLKRIGRAKSTIDTYEGHIEAKIRPALGDLPLDKLTTHRIDQFLGSLKNKWTGKALSPTTIELVHAVLRGALEQAVQWGWLIKNPAVGARLPINDREEAEPMSPADVMRMAVDAATTDEDRDGDPVLTMAIILAALTGCRRGELCGLRWEDLDVTTCSIRIERQWVRGKGGQHLSKPKSKTGMRTVYLGPEGLREIEAYRTVMRDRVHAEPDGWMLSYNGGETPLLAGALGGDIAKVAKRLGLDVTTHRFRKVQATQLVAAGVDVHTAARRMGHTRDVMFGHYLLGADDKSIEAAGTVEARLIDQGLPVGGILDQVFPFDS